MQELESEAPAICKIINNLNNLFLISLRSNDFFNNFRGNQLPAAAKNMEKLSSKYKFQNQQL